MEASLGSEDFGTILGCYDYFIIGDSEVTIKVYPNEEEYQGLLDFHKYTTLYTIAMKREQSTHTDNILGLKWCYLIGRVKTHNKVQEAC